MPRLPFARSVTATTTITPPMRPWVMKFLDPLIRQPAPSRTAEVFIPAASLPAPASVNPHAPSTSPRTSRGRYFAFCASVPNIAMCDEHSPL